jgi:hypothetical protein
MLASRPMWNLLQLFIMKLFSLCCCCTLSDVGLLYGFHYLLGIRVQQTKDHISFDWAKYFSATFVLFHDWQHWYLFFYHLSSTLILRTLILTVMLMPLSFAVLLVSLYTLPTLRALT